MAWAHSEGGKIEMENFSDLPGSKLPLSPVEMATTSAKIKELLSGKDRHSNAASLDSYMQSQLNPLASQIIKVCLPNGLAVPFPENTFSLMVNTGAKGSTVNQSQVSCALGQQALEGRRVPRMSSGRTLPSFAPYDPNPRADGFIADRFLTGLRPQEYFLHCMSGREGLVDTAVKTSRSGYLQRCLVKHMEELKVCYDSTVRDCEGGVVQFLYGEDGLDPTKAAHLDCLPSTLQFLTRNKNALLKRYSSLPNSSIDQAVEDAFWAKRSQAEPFSSLVKGMYVKARRLQRGTHWNRGLLCRGWFDAVITKCRPDARSVDLKYLIDNTKAKNVPVEITFSNCGAKFTPAASGTCVIVRCGAPDPVITDSKRFNGKYRLGQSGNCVSEKVATATSEAMKTDEKLQQTMREVGVTDEDVGKLVAVKYSSALCAPGEAVGCIAAQSIGEPSTQMTLNTFHLAGAGANVTLGIPRLREIIMTATRNLKNPTMSVPILPEVSEKAAKQLMRSFMKITLKELISCHGGISVTESIVQNNTGLWERAYQINIKLYPADRIKEAFGLRTSDIAKVVTKVFIPKLSSLMKNELRRANTDGDVQQTTVSGGESSEFFDGGDDVKSPAGKRKKAKEADEYEDEEAGDEDGVTGSRFGHRKEMVSYGDMDDEDKEIAKEGLEEDDILDQFSETDEKDEEAPMVTDDEDNYAFNTSTNALKIDRRSNTLILDPLRVDPCSRSLLMVGLVEKAASSTIVRACKGIDEAFLTDEENERGRCLSTVGLNFVDIWNLTTVDHSRLLSNDIWAIRCAYGVEAARMSIVSQISGVFAVYGISVDPRHLSLIGDYMTYDGGYKPMNRTGMMANSSPFLQMSFETTAAFMIEAAISGYTESLASPSANIVVGHPVKHGTGAFECLVSA
jgi:DNA-directed RNA polymerase I subunit RPA1